jgi:hypothetical protein
MMVTIDVGHPPRKPAHVERELYNAIEKIRNSSTMRILKVIHGNGKATRTTVRNWAYRNSKLLRLTISGESYDLFNKKTQEMRSECGQYNDPDIGSGNSGITIIWVR